MPRLVYTIVTELDEGSTKQTGQRINDQLDQATQKSASGASKATQATKEQEEALKDLRRELRRKISLVDADLRLGNKSQAEAEESIQQIRQWAEAQDAFNREHLVGAQNLKTFANAQNRAQSGFKGMSPTINRANQVLFDLNQGLQDVPFGMRGIGNNIPFVIEGFRRFGQTARQEGINPLKGFLQAMVSPAGLIGTAAAVIPTIITLMTHWDQFLSAWGLGQETTEKNTEAFKKFNDTIKETSELIPGITNLDLLSRVNDKLLKRVNLENEVANAQRRVGAQTAITRRTQAEFQDRFQADEQRLNNTIEQNTDALSEQAIFLKDLSDNERESLKDRITELKEEATTRENLNELIRLTLTERERELQLLEETTDNVLDDYLLKIGDKTPEALRNHRDRLKELTEEQRSNATELKNHLVTLEEGSEAYRHISERVDVWRQRLMDTEDQLDRVNKQLDKLRRPDVEIPLPEDDILEADIDAEGFLDRIQKERERQQELNELRRESARESVRFEREITQERLASQVTFTQRRIQLEQEFQNDVTRINHTLGLTEIEREKAIFDARKNFMQQTLQLERRVGQQRQQIDQQVAQAKIQAQQMALNAFTSLSHAFAEENKGIAIGILAIEKGLAIAQATKEGALRAGQAQMIASYYWAQSITPLGIPNPGAIAAATNAEKQVAAIAGATGLTIAAIAATGIGEGASILNRGGRTSGTATGGSAATGRQQGGIQVPDSGFMTTDSPTNFASSSEQSVEVHLHGDLDDRMISIRAESGRKGRESRSVKINSN